MLVSLTFGTVLQQLLRSAFEFRCAVFLAAPADVAKVQLSTCHVAGRPEPRGDVAAVVFGRVKVSN